MKEVSLDKKGSVLSFWNQIKSVLAGEELTSHEELVPRSRLKKMEMRTDTALEPGDLSSIPLPDGDLPLVEGFAAQKPVAVDNLLRWSCNPDKGLRQEIRKAHEMGGVAKGFAIDPLSDLD